MKFGHPLLWLTLTVATAHALLLAGVTARERQPVALPTPQVFATRTVAPPPATPAARPTAARSAPATPRAKPTTKRRTAQAPRTAPPPKQTAQTASPTRAVVSAPAPPPVWQMPSSAELLALGATELPDEQDLPVDEVVAADTPATPTIPATPANSLSPDTADPDEAPSALPAKDNAEQPSAVTGAVADAPPSAQNTSEPVPIKLPPSRRMSFEVTGKAKGLGYSALAELLWEHDATSYRAHQDVKVLFLGSRSQTSVGSITQWGLQPRRFGDRARRERAAHFDFAAGQVTFSANTPPAPIAPGAQDRLSVFLQLGAMLAAAPDRYPTGTDISMTTVSARGADVWTFSVQAEEILNLPLGSMAAVPLTRLPRREYDQKAQVWLAPSLGYLPARIRVTEANGDFVELNLRSEEAL